MTARRLHPWSIPLGILGSGRAALLVVVLVLGSGRADLGALLLIGGAALVGLEIADWSRRTYRLDPDGTLVLEEGILQRQVRTLAPARVQQVRVERRLRHMLTSTAVLSVETAGSSGPEIALDAVSPAEAERIRATILSARERSIAPDVDGPPSDGPAPPAWAPPGTDAEVVLRIGPGLLAVAGLTGAPLLIGPALVASAFGYLAELPADVAVDTTERIASGLRAVAIGGLVLVPIVAAWAALAAAASVVRHHGFVLAIDGPDLRVREGLLQVREATAPRRRVQAVEVRRPLLRRPLRLAAVHIRTAGSATQGGDASRLGIPIVRAADLPPVLDRILTGGWREVPLAPHPRAAHRRALIRRAVPVGLAATVVAAGAWPAGLVALAAVPPAIVWGVAAGRALGSGTDGRRVVARRGVVVERVGIVPYERVQSVRVTATPFQRRFGLATVRLDVAGGAAVPVPDVDLARARALAAAVTTLAPEPDPRTRASHRAC